MRIAILSDSVFPTPMPGGHGLGRMVSIVAEGLLRENHDVTLFALPGSAFSGPLVMPTDAAGQQGYAGEHALAREALTIHRQWPFDVFLDAGHLHMLACLLPSLPVVNVYHDIWQSYARCAVCVSYGEQALMPAPFERARVIQNALGPGDFRFSPRADDPPYALFVGPLVEHKQPMLAVEACARAGIKLIVAGPLVGGAQPFFSRSATLEYMGQVTPARRDRLMAGARVFLQLGHSESFGLTTLEAMLQGTPVVAWPRGGSVDLVRYGLNGVIVPRTSGDTAGAVADAITRAWDIDRRVVRVATEQMPACDPTRMIREYENALENALRGEWW